ncbi:MAG: gamma-glutamyltransferase family protein [Chloroflexota bacterium]
MSNIIVAPQPIAVEAGAKVLMNGGNAIDAAVTCAFVQGVIDPHSCGIGGYALITMHLADGSSPIAIDAPALAGEHVREDMWVNHYIGPNPDGWGYFLKDKVNTMGYTSVCTPGTVKMMATMLERWGTLSLADAVEPAAQVAEAGFMVRERLANMWKRPRPYPESTTSVDLINFNDEIYNIYHKDDGSQYDQGAILKNPGYATSLRRLGQGGAEDFYHGDFAQEMASDLAANGSSVTLTDFNNYILREDYEVVGTYRDYTVVSSGPPHGGATLIAILNILEGYDLGSMAHNSPDYIYLVSMAMKAAFADRNPYMADPNFENVPTQWMMTKERAQHWRQLIDSDEEFSVDFTATEAPSTTHVSVVDAAGNCVALTHSLGASSGVISPGMGFMYNNSMINFHPLPGHPNSIQPGKGRTTGMCPTIVYKGDPKDGGKPVLVLGSPGATRIITSNLQVILNSLDFGMSINDAVHAARFDCQVNDIRCHMRIPEFVCEEVRKKHPIRRLPYSHGGFALVEAIHIDPETGVLTGAADTGTDGMALVV